MKWTNYENCHDHDDVFLSRILTIFVARIRITTLRHKNEKLIFSVYKVEKKLYFYDFKLVRLIFTCCASISWIGLKGLDRIDAREGVIEVEDNFLCTRVIKPF